ncbi:MAG: helix-turn-helix domain-containing protein [Shewanella sp.]
MRRLVLNKWHHEIIKMVNHHHQIKVIAETFGVSRNVVYRAIKNQEKLEQGVDNVNPI